jgi:hypothetical protein
MATLTTTGSFSVGAVGTLLEESVTITVIPPPTYSSGPVGPGETIPTGRLSHPTLGVYDYPIAPSDWTNIDTDVIITPIWSHAKTISGVASTRWDGTRADQEVKEMWVGGVAMKSPQLRMFLNMWQSPPDAPDYLIWSPNYVNAYSYNVHLVDVSSGGSSGINLDYLSLQGDGFVKGPVTLTYRVMGRL